MKKITAYVIFILIASFSINAFSSQPAIRSIKTDYANDFESAEQEIYSAFDKITEVSHFIDQNEMASYSRLPATAQAIIQPDPAIVMNNQEELQPPIFGAFLWGCCYGPLGIILVASCTNNNRDQVRQAANGCIVFNILGGAIYVASLIVVINNGY